MVEHTVGAMAEILEAFEAGHLRQRALGKVVADQHDHVIAAADVGPQADIDAGQQRGHGDAPPVEFFLSHIQNDSHGCSVSGRFKDLQMVTLAETRWSLARGGAPG